MVTASSHFENSLAPTALTCLSDETFKEALSQRGKWDEGERANMCWVRRKRPRLEGVALALGQPELPGQGHTCPSMGSRPKSGLEAHLGLVPVTC